MPWTAWLAATRPKTLPAAVVPVALGAACGAELAPVDWLAVAGCLIGALLIQIGCNFANDAFDALKGADTADRVGPQRAVASGLISARTMLLATALVLGLGLAIGLWLASIAGWPILLLGLVSIAAAVGYTAGPLPLAYVGLGDLFVLLFFGLAAVLGTAWVVVHAGGGQPPFGEGWLAMPWWWWCLAAAIGLQAAGILQVNNLRDRDTDRIAGKHTLAVRLGDRPARWLFALLHTAVVLLLGAACLQRPGLWPAAIIAGLGGLLLSWAVWSRSGAALNPYLGRSAALEMITGASLILLLRVENA